MNRNFNAQSKNLSIYGNILESFKELVNLIPPNDGTRSFKITSSEAYDKPLPISGENTETTIQVTDPNHDISQLQDSFLIIDTTATIRIPELDATAFGGESPILCFALKSSNQCFRQLRILHNSLETKYLSTECLREGFAYGNLKPQAEKKSKKHIHTLYEDAHNFEPGVCGTYIATSEFKNVNKSAVVPFRFILPISDLLPLQSFSLYPSRIVGDLALKVAFTLRGLVYCQVDPSKVLEHANFMNNASNVLDVKFGATAFYDRSFCQIGDYSNILDEDGTASYISQRVAPTVTTFSVTRLSCQMMGFGIQQEAFQAIGNILSQGIALPAQELQYISYSQVSNSAGFTGSTPILFDNVECISVMFPTTTQQMTVFRNPNVQNLQLKIGETLYPPVPISTNTEVSPEFLTFQMNASDLDGVIEPTRSWMYSVTAPRTNTSGVRFANSREDNTDFMANFSTERAQGGYVFDGFSTNSPVNVELRFAPVVSGANDVYYIPDSTTPTVHPPAPELWLCRDTYWIMGAGRLQYVKNGSPR